MADFLCDSLIDIIEYHLQEKFKFWDCFLIILEEKEEYTRSGPSTEPCGTP